MCGWELAHIEDIRNAIGGQRNLDALYIGQQSAVPRVGSASQTVAQH